MLLHDLLRPFGLSFGHLPNVPISAVEEDSRHVGPGTLFVARAGTRTDGARFVEDAIARGAVVVVTEALLAGMTVPQVLVPSAARTVSQLANRLSNNPSNSVKTLGITGTNGKTTTAYLVRHLLNSVKKRCGMIGTVEIDDGWRVSEAQMTTPEAVTVARLLGTMRSAECHACAIETSSHALAQDRVAGVHFAAGAFTNLTGDHLNYHLTMDRYADAKARLFEELSEDAVAIVNSADPWSERMLRDCKSRVVRFGFDPAADYRAEDVAITSGTSHFILVTPDGRAEVKMNLVGRHNIENALVAAALCGEVFNLTVHHLAAGLKTAAGAPGRLQTVSAGQSFTVLVDYAHTDDALKNVLSALRPLTGGKLRVLFGCGGDRDKPKRPRMARTAQRLADCLYVTSDNPRTENPQTILDEIISGFVADSSKEIHVEIDRRRAIEMVIGDAQPGDVVILAGKGHEKYQTVGTFNHPFDDVEEAFRAIGLRTKAVAASR